MRPVRLFFILCIIVVLLLTAAGSTAQATSKIYGYVSYGGVPVSGAIVTLAGPDSGQTTTGENGYYEFSVNPGNYIVTAAFSGHTSSRTYVVNSAEVRVDIDISTATPTPTPTPTPTATPTPSHEPGGMVMRNESSSFIPMAPEFTVTPVPRPSVTPTPAPTILPTPTPTPTPTPGLLSNIYIWLAIALVAILIIAAAALWYIRK
jgi:uncharacterized membrane protein